MVIAQRGAWRRLDRPVGSRGGRFRLFVTLHYDDFARFFHQVDRELDRLAEVEVTYLASHLSGWIYLRRHSRRRVLLPLARLPRPPAAPAGWTERERFVAAYHVALSGGAEAGGALHRQTRALIARMDALVAQGAPDLLLLSGDSRNIERAIATATDAPRLHFEQGPDGTTILDPAGVNANCGFRTALREIGFSEPETGSPARARKAFRNPLYRGADLALAACLGAADRRPPHEGARPARRAARPRGVASAPPDGPCALVALQVAEDANNLLHNPRALDAAALAEWAAPVAAAGFPVRFREHPLSRGRYGQAFYRRLAQTPGLSLSEADLGADLAAARVVVTVNSTTGMDAYRLGKPVIVLGEAYWDRLPGIRRITRPQALARVIAALWTEEDPRRALWQGRAFATFRRRHLIPGHFRDAQSPAPRLCAERIAAALANGNPARE